MNNEHKEKLTIADLAKHIGQTATWQSENGMVFDVTILNVEIFYGAPHYTVQPVAGSGQARVRDGIKIKEQQCEHDPEYLTGPVDTVPLWKCNKCHKYSDSRGGHDSVTD